MTLEPDYVFTNNPHVITCLDFGLINDKAHVFCGDQNGNIIVWDLIVYKRVETIREAHSKNISKLRCLQEQIPTSFSEIVIVTISKDVIKLWTKNTASESLICNVKTYQLTGISMAGFSSLTVQFDQANELIIGVPNSEIPDLTTIYLMDGEKTISLSPNSKTKFGEIISIKMSEMPDSLILIAGFENGFLRVSFVELKNVFDKSSKLAAGHCHDLNLFEDMITCLDFDPSTRKGVCGSVFDHFKVFEVVGTGTVAKINVVKTVLIPNPGLSGVEIRSDSLIVATAGWDHSIRIFSWKSLKKLAISSHHKHSIKCLRFSSKITTKKILLAVASEDKTISLWSPYT